MSTDSPSEHLATYLASLPSKSRSSARRKLCEILPCEDGPHPRWRVLEMVVDHGAQIQEMSQYSAAARGGLHVRGLGARLIVPGANGTHFVLESKDVSKAGLLYAAWLIEQRGDKVCSPMTVV